MHKLLELVRRNWLFFLLATIAALALRLFFVFRFPLLEGDTWIYGGIARNWLSHGIYGLMEDGVLRPTLIRLPGYPGFLAGMFAIFGQEHYRAVLIAQAFIDTNTCLVIAALALEMISARAAKAAYLLAALCPFTAAYAAAALSETLAIFCTAHALYDGVRGLKTLQAGEPRKHLWLLAGLWTGAGILLRPDSGIILPALGLGLLVLAVRPATRKQAVVAGIILAVASLGPLAPWTARNWRVFHLWQPLAPRYANDPAEFLPRGFNHWAKTWIADSVSVTDVFWKVDGEPIDPNTLPERAFDSRREYDHTLDVISRYNQQLYVDPELDRAFDQIAIERENHNPVRYYLWLPFLRTADMWLRPRTEMLDIEARWWEFSEHEGETVFALAWAALNFFYLAAAWSGTLRHRLGIAGACLIAFLVLRSLFLSTLENPEPRYVLECFPVIIALAGGAFTESTRRKPRPDPPGAAA